MEDSYETFEEELGPPRPPPQKPGRQLLRPAVCKPAPVQSQSAALVDRPWQGVTLNRCLFVVVTILLLTNGMHRLHELMRGQRSTEEEEEVVATRRSALRRKALYNLPEPDSSLWEVVMLWWPDFDDDGDDDCDEDECDDDVDDDGCGVANGGTPQRAASRRGVRNRARADKKSKKGPKQHGRLKEGAAGRDDVEGLKEKTKQRTKPKERQEEEEHEEEEEEEEEMKPKKKKTQEKKNDAET